MLSSYHKVQFFQNFSAQLIRSISSVKGTKAKEEKVIFLEGIDNFIPADLEKNKHALVALSPSAWLTALNEYPNIKYFNHCGLMYEIVKIFNENGYMVDVIDMREKGFIPKKDYKIFLGHGGNLAATVDNLKGHAKIIQYVAGEYWREFNKESEERYRDFCRRKNLPNKIDFKRSFNGIAEGEEYLTENADILFTCNCPRMINSYGKYKSKFFFTGLASYLNNYMKVSLEDKDFQAGRKNFIYVGGTGGNIQKGMDLFIEAFSRRPELNLYIYCRIEDEVLSAYKKELSQKNIHYIYHWRLSPFHNRLRNLMTRTNFTLHAPVNCGLGTAFMGSMGLGLIPVGYVDLIAPEESSVLADYWNVDSLIRCIDAASNKPAEWCKNASNLTQQNYQKNWSVESFKKNFSELIKTI